MVVRSVTRTHPSDVYLIYQARICKVVRKKLLCSATNQWWQSHISVCSEWWRAEDVWCCMLPQWTHLLNGDFIISHRRRTKQEEKRKANPERKGVWLLTPLTNRSGHVFTFTLLTRRKRWTITASPPHSSSHNTAELLRSTFFFFFFFNVFLLFPSSYGQTQG